MNLSIHTLNTTIEELNQREDEIFLGDLVPWATPKDWAKAADAVRLLLKGRADYYMGIPIIPTELEEGI